MSKEAAMPKDEIWQAVGAPVMPSLVHPSQGFGVHSKGNGKPLKLCFDVMPGHASLLWHSITKILVGVR